MKPTLGSNGRQEHPRLFLIWEIRYYYLYAFWVKTSHGFQALLVLATLATLNDFWRRLRLRAKHHHREKQPVSAGSPANCELRDLLVLLAPALVVFVLVSAETAFNHHFRYVLPAFGCLMVFCGSTILCLTISVRPVMVSGLGPDRPSHLTGLGHRQSLFV